MAYKTQQANAVWHFVIPGVASSGSGAVARAWIEFCRDVSPLSAFSEGLPMTFASLFFEFSSLTWSLRES
jgi:hypothetical protein